MGFRKLLKTTKLMKEQIELLRLVMEEVNVEKIKIADCYRNEREIPLMYDYELNIIYLDEN